MESSLDSEKQWSVLQKTGFRFVFIFFVLLIVKGNFNELLHQLIPWVGAHVLKLSYPITVFPNGSGDTTYDYVLILFCFSTAFLGMMLWSLIDRNKPSYRVLLYWLTVAVRFYVALILISYGLSKFFKTQFPSPGLPRLMQPYGYSSPMGLAWTFLGFSKGYNFFMGVAELAAGLLFFRRTVTIGAIITLMTTANIVAINYFYDVPVKIFSTTLFVMTLFLVLPDLKRLAIFFFSSEPVSLPVMRLPEFKRKWIYRAGTVLKLILLASLLTLSVVQHANVMDQYGDHAPKSPLYGLYHVETFVFQGDTLPPLTTNNTRWRDFMIDGRTSGGVRMMTDSIHGFGMRVDTITKTIEFQGYSSFYYSFSDSSHFSLTGNITGYPAFISGTVTKNSKNFKLTGRGFHWINEYPYNR